MDVTGVKDHLQFGRELKYDGRFRQGVFVVEEVADGFADPAVDLRSCVAGFVLVSLGGELGFDVELFWCPCVPDALLDAYATNEE